MSPSLSRSLAPYWLSLPAFALFAVMLFVPLLMTAMLSFYSFDYNQGIQPGFSWHNYADVVTDGYFHEIFWRTFRYGIIVTLLCILIGVPEAYILNRMGSPWRAISLLAIIGPLLISVVVRTLGWVILMGNNGLVNEGLNALGLGRIPFIYTETGVIVALVHVMIPFMIISVWAVLQKVDPATENAAASLGASQMRVFFRVVVPQVIPGILSGALIVFSLTTSAFATPSIIGGRRLKVASTTIYDEFLNTLEWPLGAAIAITLLLGIMAIIIGWNRLIERRYAQVFQ
ncbi:MAG: transporter [Cereibacter sp.]|jgi:putative spermidine/putrescine transport system permease protein|nr:transporter [Cereibacter sp.]